MSIIHTSDPAVIAALHQAELAEAGRRDVPSVTDIAAEWRRHPDAQFIIVSDDQPIGFLAYQVTKRDVLYISDLYVAPAHRRHGWGRKLLAEVLQTGRSLELVVEADNHPARNLYRSCGFLERDALAHDGKIRMQRSGNRTS